MWHETPYTSVAWRRVWPMRQEAQAVQLCCKAGHTLSSQVPGTTVDRRLPVNSGAARGIAQNGHVSRNACPRNLRKQECVSKHGSSWSYTALSRELADDCGLCGRPNSRAQYRNAMATATRQCVLKNVAKGPQCRDTENKQTYLNEQDGKGIRSRMLSIENRIVTANSTHYLAYQ